jgi:Rps23 Pro-64 3,4-dihydroxylase Tpa1-like proline 4-hydroxylase
LKINPNLNVELLKKQFSTNSRLHIPNFLEQGDASQLLEYIESFNEWNLSLNSGDKHFDINYITRKNVTHEFYKELEASVGRDALLGFQYLFENYPLYDAYYSGSCSEELAKLFRFINGKPFLDCIRNVTKYVELTFADAQLTKFSSGHFLTSHDDNVSGKNRRIAYVLNLTPIWDASWGGLLQFHSDDFHIEQAFVPCFNSLNIFSVPQNHSVSQIASYVKKSRYCITGWVREGVDPKLTNI